MPSRCRVGKSKELVNVSSRQTDDESFQTFTDVCSPLFASLLLCIAMAVSQVSLRFSLEPEHAE